MTTFKDLALNENIIKALTDLGYENPTEIQEKAIPLISKPDPAGPLTQMPKLGMVQELRHNAPTSSRSPLSKRTACAAGQREPQCQPSPNCAFVVAQHQGALDEVRKCRVLVLAKHGLQEQEDAL